MKKPTDDDVMKLVAAVTNLVDGQGTISNNKTSTWVPLWKIEALRETLTPFLPDPEEVLIDKMAKAYNCTGNPYATMLERMRAALEVVKQEGLPS